MMDMILFFLLLTCVIDIAVNLYVLEMNTSIDLATITAVVDMLFATGFTFTYFYLSEWITADLVEISDHFYNSPWCGVLVAKQQRLLVLTIQQAQREVRLKGLGLFDGSLAVFLSVFVFLNFVCFSTLRQYILKVPLKSL